MRRVHRLWIPESTVKLAKADLVPTDAKLRALRTMEWNHPA